MIGINPSGTEVPIYTLNETQKDFDISGVIAENYPYMRLRMRNADSLNKNSPWQLRYWNVIYTDVP